jgi:ribonuclease HII
VHGQGKNLPLLPGVFAPADPFFHEKAAVQAGYGIVAGVDEAGRGPLAGPVVASAVIISENPALEGVRDSKKMSPKSREEAFSIIGEKAASIGIGVVSHTYIDQYNILRASLEAMRIAVMSLHPRPDFLLVDGIHPISVNIPQRCLVRGDQISRSISCASVMAKVYRDRIMDAFHGMFPQYGFEHNKGYGTLAHYEALRTHGPCIFHRLTFRGVVDLDKGKTESRKLW